MFTMKQLAFGLDLANSISFVVAVVLWFVLMAHMIHICVEKNLPRANGDLVIKIKLHAVLDSMFQIAIWLAIDMTGVVITRATVWYWRRIGVGGAGGPMNFEQTEFMLLAAILMVVGTVGITYVISHRTLGNWPWRLSLAAVLLTVAFYVVSPWL